MDRVRQTKTLLTGKVGKKCVLYQTGGFNSCGGETLK